MQSVCRMYAMSKVKLMHAYVCRSLYMIVCTLFIRSGRNFITHDGIITHKTLPNLHSYLTNY